MKVFVTGGAGYIGSHTLIELLKQQNDVCVFDNFSNSSPEALARVRQLANAGLEQIEGDVRDDSALTRAMTAFQPDIVVHFAGLKAVGKSNSQPLQYYQNNVQGSISLLMAMSEVGCRRIVFSSSATVYGEAQYLPFDEAHPISPINPYGRTKFFIEEIIRDWTKSDANNSAVVLRYFNPVGAHESGRIGEDPDEVPENLMPYISQVAVGRRPELLIFGSDYDTRDGTGERDYIHVTDLARAHLAAINFCVKNNGCDTFNVGTGTGVTVLEMVRQFEQVSGRKISCRVVKRRPGDVASSVASVKKASELLGWQATLGLEEMCRSAWRWQNENPNGYPPYGPGGIDRT